MTHFSVDTKSQNYIAVELSENNGSVEKLMTLKEIGSNVEKTNIILAFDIWDDISVFEHTNEVGNTRYLCTITNKKFTFCSHKRWLKTKSSLRNLVYSSNSESVFLEK